MKMTFGDDGSAACDRAWSWIGQHRWPGWRIEVVRADEHPSHMQWGEPLRLRPATPPPGRSVDGLDADGVGFFEANADPRALLAQSTTDLLVVGLKDRGPLQVALVGSTAEWLLHHPPSPLALVRRSERVRRVLVCADGSVHSQRAVDALASFPWIGDCTIDVLTVDDGRADPDAAQSTAERLTLVATSVESRAAAGSATGVILDAMTDLGPDLVVMGTRGLTGWHRLRLGSTASAVVRSSNCDHLVACVD